MITRDKLLNCEDHHAPWDTFCGTCLNLLLAERDTLKKAKDEIQADRLRANNEALARVDATFKAAISMQQWNTDIVDTSEEWEKLLNEAVIFYLGKRENNMTAEAKPDDHNERDVTTLQVALYKINTTLKTGIAEKFYEHEAHALKEYVSALEQENAELKRWRDAYREVAQNLYNGNEFHL